MTKERPPAFQLYVKDILTSNKVSMMDVTAAGGYLFLLFHAWLGDPVGTLPNDDKTLAKLSRLGNRRWGKFGTEIRSCFKVDGHKLVSEKLTSQFAELLEYTGAQSKSGKAGADKRWGRHRFANGVAIVSPLANDSSSSSSSSSSSKETTRAPARVIIPDDLLANTAEIMDWLEYKRQKGQAYKSKGLEALWRAIRVIPAAKRRESVDHCMANNWAGLFEKKGDAKTGNDSEKGYHVNYIPSVEETQREMREIHGENWRTRK